MLIWFSAFGFTSLWWLSRKAKYWMVISSLLNIAHAACKDLLRVLLFVRCMSHDIFISRESLLFCAMTLLFYSLWEKPTSAKKCVSATDSDKPLGLWRKGAGFWARKYDPDRSGFLSRWEWRFCCSNSQTKQKREC